LHPDNGTHRRQTLTCLPGSGLRLIGLGCDRPRTFHGLGGMLLGALGLGLQGAGYLLRLFRIPFRLLQTQLSQARLGR
jgi:hypothetical protein